MRLSLGVDVASLRVPASCACIPPAHCLARVRLNICLSWHQAAEWVHGDLGCVTPADVVVCISHSGNTQELVHAMSYIQARNPPPTILSIVRLLL
jgi:DNA-binding MurR/RpiR family transcriptional regulator